jgi:hypothetical protein
MYMNREGIKFGYKDTWSLDEVLKPVIAKGVIKFRDTLLERDEKGLCVGYPSSVIQPQDFVGDEVTENNRFQEWIDILGEMIYAFTADEPDPHEYYKLVEGPRHMEETKNGCRRWDLIPDNPEGKIKHNLDLHAHYHDVNRGLNLFAKHYKDLWW